jgi:hypothetical protein
MSYVMRKFNYCHILCCTTVLSITLVLTSLTMLVSIMVNQSNNCDFRCSKVSE